MKIIKVGLGNTDEAYIESKLSDGINIISVKFSCPNIRMCSSFRD